ncbi:hypothetical protein EBU71_04735 [bacterium]|nr:hypothetical protein [Candidatus Elulimicrobium humile]
MLLYFTDAQTKQPIAVNPNYVVVVFSSKNEEGEFTVINTTTGNVVVDMSLLEVVGQIQGELK